MYEWNVYEQRNGKLRLRGIVEGADGAQALDNARKKFSLRWPVVHMLDYYRNEVHGDLQ